MRVLLAENGDSFTWNVVEALPFARAEVTLVPGRALARDPGALDGFDALVVGPGPTDPERAGLVGLVAAAAARRLPVLGICLGHQAIGLAFGARLRRSEPAHGKLATVAFGPSRLFPGVEGELVAMRYHSLSLDALAPPLRAVAWAGGLCMAVEHEALPIAGLQFHPDSYATERGRELLAAFFGAVGVRSGTGTGTGTETGTQTESETGTGTGTGTAISLSSLSALPSFALLGPGFTGGSWRLLSPLVEDPAASDLLLWPFEAGSPLRLRAGGRRDGPLAIDVPPARVEPALDARGHAEAVARIREAIAAGDVYQVNLTLRARLPPVPGAGLLAALCAGGAPPYAAWLRLPGGRELVSASPELLLRADGERVSSEPMKGTARDEAALAASAKDRAELAMITDLVRHDLAPVCAPGSVRVARVRELRRLPYAAQAVSVVEGRLAPGRSGLDALAALVPAGSVVGAPKPAALAALRALERSPRGAYCGALAHGDGPRLVASVLIRTAERPGPEAAWIYGAGGGIVWDSDAGAELAEVETKLGALRPPGEIPEPGHPGPRR